MNLSRMLDHVFSIFECRGLHTLFAIDIPIFAYHCILMSCFSLVLNSSWPQSSTTPSLLPSSSSESRCVILFAPCLWTPILYDNLPLMMRTVSALLLLKAFVLKTKKEVLDVVEQTISFLEEYVCLYLILNLSSMCIVLW